MSPFRLRYVNEPLLMLMHTDSYHALLTMQQHSSIADTHSISPCTNALQAHHDVPSAQDEA